jgi:hypothetical protein
VSVLTSPPTTYSYTCDESSLVSYRQCFDNYISQVFLVAWDTSYVTSVEYLQSGCYSLLSPHDYYINEFSRCHLTMQQRWSGHLSKFNFIGELHVPSILMMLWSALLSKRAESMISDNLDDAIGPCATTRERPHIACARAAQFCTPYIPARHRPCKPRYSPQKATGQPSNPARAPLSLSSRLCSRAACVHQRCAPHATHRPCCAARIRPGARRRRTQTRLHRPTRVRPRHTPPKDPRRTLRAG